MSKSNMDKKYRAVVIGCGKVGALWGMDAARVQPASHAAACLTNSQVILAGLVDSNDAAREKAGVFFKTPTWGDAEAALEECKPDIVVIATPPHTHEELLVLLLARNVPAVICEKPLSGSVTSARRMYEQGRTSKSIVIINHQRRFFPLYIAAQSRIARGGLGVISKARGDYSKGLFNNGSHMVDALCFLLGTECQWVRGRQGIGQNIDGTLGWGGAVVELRSHENNTEIHNMLLTGSAGALKIDEYGYKFTWAKVTSAGREELDWEHAQVEYDKRSMLADVLTHAVECLDGAASPRSTLADGLKAVEILDALQKSAAEDGSRIEL